MDFILQLIKDNFVLIILFIVALLIVRVVAQKLLPILGGIFVIGVLIYGFTGDESFLQGTVNSTTKAVDSVKAEVGTAEFKRTSDSTFEVTTKTISVKGDETTKLATVKTGDKVVEVPLKSLYDLMPDNIQKQINIKE
ncbi:hypothetical protein [Rossellomorea marisflavi]|uniref:hypothetical protein n=1 Tax=Rossellomorea marisflavi TaxID=189381 RepID=UPI003F9F6E10